MLIDLFAHALNLKLLANKQCFLTNNIRNSIKVNIKIVFKHDKCDYLNGTNIKYK